LLLLLLLLLLCVLLLLWWALDKSVHAATRHGHIHLSCA
jgi:hypothetical protein